MKVLLQQSSTGFYFQGPGLWTRQIQDGTDFVDSQCAIEFARRQRMSDVAIVVAFLASDYVETVQLRISRSPRV